MTNPGMPLEFWECLQRLLASSRIVLDSPAGSPHPDFPELVYPIDFGYLDSTVAFDGGSIKVWVGSQSAFGLDALAVTANLEKREVEVALLSGCTQQEKQLVQDFLNATETHVCLVFRDQMTNWLQSRRSVRCFRPDPIPPLTLEHILEAATWAPSAHNRQPWRFAVLASKEAKLRLSEKMGADFEKALLLDGFSSEQAQQRARRSRQRITAAPAAILLCLDAASLDAYPDPVRQRAEEIMAVQSVALAGGHLLLAAHALGLGAVWMCAPLFSPEAVKDALPLPDSWRPQALVLLGFPRRPPEPRSRKPWQDIALYF